MTKLLSDGEWNRFLLILSRIEKGELCTPETVELARYCRKIEKFLYDTNEYLENISITKRKIRKEMYNSLNLLDEIDECNDCVKDRICSIKRR